MPQSARTKDKIDLLTRITVYHEDLDAFHTRFQNYLHAFSAETSERVLASFRDYYTTSLCNHFAFEEKIVFPAVLAHKRNASLAGLIDALCDEHTAIRNSIQAFLAANDRREGGLAAADTRARRTCPGKRRVNAARKERGPADYPHC
jgi:iron-sulfur cluster repair protein YtfE (RIC family)